MAGLEIGSTFGGYRIERVIGRGGMGVVYLGEHIRLEVRHALKVVAPEHAEDPQFVDRFIREARLAASLDHPNIIPIYGADEVGGIPFIAMRYVRGTNLGEVIARDGALDTGRALAILDQVSSALDAAHAQGLVHRDVKPANILIAEPSSPSSTGQVFLTDFGLTKRMDSTSKMTKTGMYLGTLSYCAPEQLRAEPLDGRTDEYALAAVMFECLTGSPPFEREMEAQVVAAHLADQPPAIVARRPDLSPAIDDVVGRGMAKAREDRFPTCAALIGAARNVLVSGAGAGDGGSPTVVQQQGTASPPAGGAPPSPALAPPVAAPSAPTGALLPPDQARTRTRRVRLLTVVIPIVLVAGLVVGGITVLGGNGGGSVPVATGSAPSRTSTGSPRTSTAPALGPPNTVVETIKVGSEPEGAAFGDGSLWVTNLGDGTVSRIDSATNKVVATIKVGDSPYAIAFGAGAVWAVNSGPETVSRIDPATNEVVDTIKVGTSPFAAAFGDGALWVANREDGTVTRVDPATNRAALTFAVGRKPGAIAVGAGAAWITTIPSTFGQVSRVDTTTNTVAATIDVGKRPLGAAFGEGAVWITNVDGNNVSRIDPATNVVVRTIPVGGAPWAATVGAGAVWVVNSNSDNVFRIDPATNEVVAKIEVQAQPVAAAFGDGSVWVVNSNTGTVSRIQP